MVKARFILAVLFLGLATMLFGKDGLRNGDIVFQSESGNFARAIQLATRSPYNHVGMVFIQNGEPYVFEAVGPVKFTPLVEWAKRGKDGRFIVKRLKDADRILTPKVIGKMDGLARQFKGRSYDWTFGLTDGKMYCSELVWKMYRRSTGLELGRYQKLKDLDLSHPLVRSQMREKFGDHIPSGLKVITPAGVFKSDLLVNVDRNGG